MKKASLSITLIVLSSAIIYSCSSDDDTAASSDIQTSTSKPDVARFTLTVSAGEGGSVSTEGGTYDEGTKVTITANPKEGYGFAGWTNFESNSKTINITLNSDTSVSASFITLPSLSMLSSSTSIFTKSKKDTLTFEANVPGGFNKLEINLDNGDFEIVSQPEIGAKSGKIKLSYEPQVIVNVDYTRTIAGYEDISVSLFDSYDNNSSDNVRVTTQPEPLLGRNYLVPSHDTEFSRVKVDPYLIRYLNEKDNYSLGCYNNRNYGESTNHNENGNEFDLLRDIAFIDLNLDGYDDLVIHPNYWDGGTDTFTSVELPIEVYLYENGEYVYKEVMNQNGLPIKAKLVSQFLVGDFDNDGNPDLYCANFGRDSPPYDMEDSFFLFNDMNTRGYFSQITNPHVNFGHNASSGDIDKDGDLDIFQNGRLPESDGLFDFVINNGNRTFSKGSLMEDFRVVTDNMNSVGYKFPFFQGIYTSELFDIDKDGNLDLFLIGHEYEDNSTLMPWIDSEYIDSFPWQSSSGKIIYGSSDNNFYQTNIKFIPTVQDRGLGLDFDIYDLDSNGQNEIIILRTGDSTLGISSDSPDYNENQNSTNFYQGYYIQICQIDNNRNIVDVTDQFMDGNGQGGIALGCENKNFMFLQIGDYDDNGKLDMYCEDSRLGPNFVRWEWNGSRFTNKTP